jgi:hypothetical protein
MVRILGALACALLLLTSTACGGGDDDQAAEALSKSLRDNGGGDNLELSKKQADCVAEKMVDNVGTEDLKKAGILTDDLEVKKEVGSVKMSSSDAKGAADAMVDCVDAVELMSRALADTGGAEVADCLREKLTEDDMRTFFQALFEGDAQSASSKLLKPVMACADASQ